MCYFLASCYITAGAAFGSGETSRITLHKNTKVKKTRYIYKKFTLLLVSCVVIIYHIIYSILLLMCLVLFSLPLLAHINLILFRIEVIMVLHKSCRPFSPRGG